MVAPGWVAGLLATVVGTADAVNLPFCTEAGPVDVELRGERATGTYVIVKPGGPTPGKFEGTIRSNRISAHWKDADGSGELHLSFDADRARFVAVYNNEKSAPDHWHGPWIGIRAEHVASQERPDRWRCRFADAADSCVRGPLLLTNVWVWPSENTRTPRDLLIVDRRIEAIAPAGTLSHPGARTIDGTGTTALPGLVDAHAHLYELGGPTPPSFRTKALELALPVSGRMMLRSGVTTARLHLSHLAHAKSLLQRSDDACAPLPHLQIGGPGFFGGRPSLAGFQVWGARDVEDARRKVARVAEAGLTWIAVHDIEMFPDDVRAAIFAEARTQDLRVMVEGDSTRAIKLALDLGADSVEYLDFHPHAYQTLKHGGQHQRTFFVVPVGYYARTRAYQRHEAELRPGPLEHLLSRHVLGPLIEGAREAVQSHGDKTSRFEESFARLRRTGAPMAVGTDCGSPGHFHHDAIWWDLETRRSLGVDLDTVLHTATRGGAELLRLPDTGRLARSHRGDVILYAGRPEDGPLHASRVRVVVKGGVVFVEGGRWVGP